MQACGVAALSAWLALGVASATGCGSTDRRHAPPTASTLDLDPVQEPARTGRRARNPDPTAPAAAAAPIAAAGPAEVRARPTYRGKRIDIDLKQAELHDVFRLLAEVGGVNIVVSDDVTGTITLRLRRVPWDQVLDTVVATKHLQMVREHGIYRVSAR